MLVRVGCSDSRNTRTHVRTYALTLLLFFTNLELSTTKNRAILVANISHALTFSRSLAALAQSLLLFLLVLSLQNLVTNCILKSTSYEHCTHIYNTFIKNSKFVTVSTGHTHSNTYAFSPSIQQPGYSGLLKDTNTHTQAYIFFGQEPTEKVFYYHGTQATPVRLSLGATTTPTFIKTRFFPG